MFNPRNAWLTALTAGLLTLPLLSGCGRSSTGTSAAGGGNVIKIVSSLPRTGSAKAQTDTIVNGIKMALEDVNHKVGDFTIEYADWDDATAAAGAWDAAQESANADRAIKDRDVMIYLGPYNSGAAKISMPTLNKAGLLMISMANTAPGLTKPGKGESNEPGVYRPSGKVNYTRVVPADDLQGTVSADWAKALGIKKVFILDDTEVYGRGIAKMFKERCEEIGLEVSGNASIDAKATEFKSLMTRIKEANPDLVYFGGTTQSKGGQIAKDLVASGMTCKLMVPDGCYEAAFITSAGADNLNDRCYVTFGGFPPDKLEGGGRVFVERYQQKHGQMPEAYAVYGYEAAKVALEAIKRANQKDRAAITQACLGIKDFDGALGKWSFDENGDTTLAVMSGNTVKNGQFEFVKVLGQ